MDTEADGAVLPLTLNVPRPAREAFADAIEWLRATPPPFGGEEAAQRFSFALDRELLYVKTSPSGWQVEATCPAPMKKPRFSLRVPRSGTLSQRRQAANENEDKRRASGSCSTACPVETCCG